MKHAVLALVLTHLNRKDTPYRVIDTHAGLGVYDLAEERAQKTSEWRGRHRPARQGRAGITIRVADRGCGPARALPRRGRGSPARTSGRPCIPARPRSRGASRGHRTRLIFVEKHPRDVLALQELREGRRARQGARSWTAGPRCGPMCPPREKRGLVLIDPPFEETDEFDRLARGRRSRRGASGVPASSCSGTPSSPRAMATRWQRPSPPRAPTSFSGSSSSRSGALVTVSCVAAACC